MRAWIGILLGLSVLAVVGCGGGNSTPPAQSQGSPSPPPPLAAPSPAPAAPAAPVASGPAAPASPAAPAGVVGSGPPAGAIDPITGRPIAAGAVPSSGVGNSADPFKKIDFPDGFCTMEFPGQPLRQSQAANGVNVTYHMLQTQNPAATYMLTYSPSPVPESLISAAPALLTDYVKKNQAEMAKQYGTVQSVREVTLAGAHPGFEVEFTAKDDPTKSGRARIYFVGKLVYAVVAMGDATVPRSPHAERFLNSLTVANAAGPAIASSGPTAIDPLTGRPISGVPGSGGPAAGGNSSLPPVRPSDAGGRIDPITGRPISGVGAGGVEGAPLAINPAAGGVGNPAAGPVGSGVGASGQPAAGGGQTVAPDDLAGQAALAMREGREADAFQYTYANLVVTGEDGLKVCRGLKRMTAGVRFGIGVVYTPPKDFTISPQPPRAAGNGAFGANGFAGAGVPQPPQPVGPNQPRGPRGQPVGPRPGVAAGPVAPGINGIGNSGPGVDQPQAMLSWYCGELGEEMVAAIQARVEEGKFGDLLQKAAPKGNPAGGAAGAVQQFPGGEVRPQFNGAAGGFPGGVPGGPGGVGAAAGGSRTSAPLTTGVTLLGLGEFKLLQEKAAREGVDVLIVYQVAVKPLSKGGFNSTTTALIYDVQSRSQIAALPVYDALNVYLAREKKQNDPMAAILEKFTKLLDESISLSDLPGSFNAARAAARSEQLSASPSEHPLPALAELRLYHAKKLIADADFAAAAAKVAGEKAAKAFGAGVPTAAGLIAADLLPKGGAKRLSRGRE